MALTSVFGFFYRIGSLDYPVNYDPNMPFGFNDEFDVSPTDAVFKYSINDVENALVACRTLVRNSFWTHKVESEELIIGAGKSSDVMIVDSTGGYSDIIQEDISASEWTDAFKIVEFLHNNQSRVPGNPTSNEYLCWGDQMLAVDEIFRVPGYKINSLYVEQSSLPGRIKFVTFNVIFSSENIVRFTFYFDADAFVERTDNIKYKVYCYEDLDEPVDQISPDEMREQIFRKIFEMSRDGKYKMFRDYFLDKRISDQDDFVREQFFIVSTLNNEIDDNIARLAIKRYLIDRYNNDLAFLRYTYPGLFNENEIHLIPIYDNFANAIQGETSSSNTIRQLYPLSLEKLNTELSTFGYIITPSHGDYRPTEIFYIGPGDEWIPSLGSSFGHLIPIIAIELDDESAIRFPISARFPDFRPIYGTEEGGTPSSEFHRILVKMFDYFLGRSTILDHDFREMYNVIIYEAGSGEGLNSSGDTVSGGLQPNPVITNRKRISFEYSGYLWLLYGPIPV